MKRRGSSLLESCMILLLFLVLLIGVADVSQLMFFHHFLQQRARAGARFAAVHAYNRATITNVVVYNSKTAGATGLFGLQPSMVSVNLYDPGTPAERVEVAISGFEMRFVSPWLAREFAPGPFRAVLPVESGGSAM